MTLWEQLKELWWSMLGRCTCEFCTLDRERNR